jgi:hypothetical protein
MNPTVLALVLGLEFGPSGTNPESTDLSASLDAIESGGWSLAPYTGPVLKPYVVRSFGRLRLGLAPAVRWSQQTATALDGREGTVKTLQWAAEGRVWWQPSLERGWMLGVDGGHSDGSATLEGEEVAAGTPRTHLHPSVGHIGALSEHWSLVGRALWVVSWTGESMNHGPGGALAVEWGR